MKKWRMFVLCCAVILLVLLSIQKNALADPSSRACWGQATMVFAQMGVMGEHASQQENPRFGLRNLAKVLYDAGVLPDDSMQALGAFVAAELGLTIDACIDD